MTHAKHPKGSCFVLVKRSAQAALIAAAQYFAENDLRLKCERTAGHTYVCFNFRTPEAAKDLQKFINKKLHEKQHQRTF